MDADTALSLNVIGVSEGTDKSSLIGDYLRHYESLFAPLRYAAFNMIEIGVFRGSSVRMWQRYFERARIIGVDIDPDCRKYATDRVTIEIGSQSDPQFLHHLAATYPPLIIIDDGSHRSEDIIFSFERLFPALRPGGWYIVEDVHFHMMPHEVERLRGNSDRTATEYLTQLVNDRMRAKYDLSAMSGIHRYLVQSIDRIYVMPQAVAICKVDASVDDDLLALRKYIEPSTRGDDWFHYGMRLKELGHPLDEVRELLERAVKLSPDAPVYYERLADVYFEAGERQRAAQVLESAIQHNKLDSHFEAILRERAAIFRRA